MKTNLGWIIPLVPIGLLVAWHTVPAAQLNHEQEALRRDHIPVDAAKLQRPTPPARLNAAVDYSALMQLLKRHPLSKAEDQALLRIGGSGTPNATTLSEVSQIIATRPDVMTLIHRAADKPYCVFQRNWSQAFEMDLSEYATIRKAARLISMESLMLAQEGHYPAAIANQGRGFRIAAHAASEPLVIPLLVGVACDLIAVNGMEAILRTSGPNLAVANQVFQTTQRLRPHFDVSYALQGEPATVFAAMDKVEADVEKEDNQTPYARQLTAAVPDSIRHSPAGPAFTIPVIHDLHALILAAREPRSQRLALFPRLTAERHEASPFLDLRNILLPVFSHAAEREARAYASEEVLLASAEVMAFRARHGSYPGQLDAALSPVPLDPFSDRPLGYRWGVEGFSVWSVGETRSFQGVLPAPASSTSTSPPIEFHYGS